MSKIRNRPVTVVHNPKFLKIQMNITLNIFEMSLVHIWLMMGMLTQMTQFTSLHKQKELIGTPPPPNDFNILYFIVIFTNCLSGNCLRNRVVSYA